MINLKNITKKYKSKNLITQALDNINIEFENKGFYFILGPSGSGKTTLLNILGTLDSSDSGEMIINDVNINKFTQGQKNKFRNSNIGFIFQSYNVINYLTVYENISLPLQINKIPKKTIKEKTNKLLKQLGLEKEKNKYPSQLSGGQIQRVAIARALITDPKIILADEPTGALDSKNTRIVMNILKEISQECLVVMVTHNSSLAKEYGTTIIKLLDGQVEEIKVIKKNDNINKKKENKFFKLISFVTSLKLGIRNMLAKRFRSLFTILGSSIGILAACIVIAISNSMENYSDYSQKQALSAYPITISSSINEDDDILSDDKKYESYPGGNTINIVNNYSSYYNHINVFSNDYIEYLNKLDENLYTAMDYGNFLNLHIMSKSDTGYSYVSNSSYIKEISDNKNYLESEYEILYGDNYPSKINEVALVIDKNNCIDAYVLSYLKIDYKNIESYTFEEICNKEFKVIVNNDYYTYNEQKDIYEMYAKENDELKQKELYEKSEITLKITAILRQKKSALNLLYKPGLLYTKALTQYMHNDNTYSNIVQDQIKYGLEKNVLTGSPYYDIVGDFYTQTKEYNLEVNYRSFGYYYSISYIKIYTDKFENRALINKYLSDYNENKDLDRQVLYSDYMGNMTKEFDGFIKTLMLVFAIFSGVALFVSGLMIALLMYVSVNERIKEIGILRCLGYSKFNVGLTFVLEGGVIGFISGAIGIFISSAFLRPILKIVADMVQNNYSSSFDVSTITSTKFDIFQLIIILFGSIIISMIAALIPAFIASTKDPVKSIRNNGE